MRSLKPWLRITDLRQELDRLFDRVFESRPDEFPATGDWVPSLDLSETGQTETWTAMPGERFEIVLPT